MMVAKECFACGHQNKPGAWSCAACSTSLNLKLCAACEAVNALAAASCHDCGASLVEDLQVQEVPAPVQAAERLFREGPRIRLLPLQQNSRPPARTRRFAGLWIVSVALAAGVGYYLASRVPSPVAASAPTDAASHPPARAGSMMPAPEAPAPTRAPAVTHTGALAGAVEEPAAAASEKPVDNHPAGCAPAQAVLGLCNAN